VKKIIFAVLGISILFGAILLTTAQSGETTSNGLPKLKNPRIVVKKGERILQLFDGEKLIKTYKIALGFAPEGDKEKEGDGKTPEGEFYIFTKNPKSNFHLSLGVSYPSADDAERGLKARQITKKERDAIATAIRDKKMPLQKTALGGEVYIHGGGVSRDWTWGCVALENADIKEIFDAIPVGVTVKIVP
jgi:murein L,D-transpeptidase YafK